MMLEAFVRDLVAERVEKIVVRVMMRPEQLVGLLHQRAMRLQLLRLHDQQFGPVGEQIQMHRHGAARIQIEAGGVAPGVQRTVDQGLEVRPLESRVVRIRGVLLERRGDFQPVGATKHSLSTWFWEQADVDMKRIAGSCLEMPGKKSPKA